MSDLKPCPFCGGGETRIDEKKTSPTMESAGNVISVTVRHWCEKEEGQPHSLAISITRRDKESATKAWNTRSTPVITDEMIERAARAIYELAPISIGLDKNGNPHPPESWENIDRVTFKEEYEDMAKAALQAALGGGDE